MPTVEIRWVRGTPVTVMTTELNSLGTGSAAISSTIDNDAALATYADFELYVNAITPSAPADGVDANLYLVRTDDGTNFENGATSGPVLPRDGFAGVFVFRAVATAQRLVLRGVRLPPRDFKVMLYSFTNRTFDTSANTLTMVPYTMGVV